MTFVPLNIHFKMSPNTTIGNRILIIIYCVYITYNDIRYNDKTSNVPQDRLTLIGYLKRYNDAAIATIH